jgi:hypothetical protein
MTTLSVNRMGRDLRCGLPAEPARTPLRAMLVALLVVIAGVISLQIPASAMPSMPSLSVADLGVAAHLLASAADDDSRADSRELLQCHRHAYRHHLDPATCELVEP